MQAALDTLDNANAQLTQHRDDARSIAETLHGHVAELRMSLAAMEAQVQSQSAQVSSCCKGMSSPVQGH